MKVTAATAVELPPRYYLDNFHRLCDTVESQYGDLLRAEEQDWLRLFRELPLQSQCLYLRLASRVGPLFRLSRLDYPEIGPLATPVLSLEEAGFLQCAQELAAAEAGRLYTRPELRDRFPALLPAGRDKAADIEALEQWAAREGESALFTACARDDALVAPTRLEWMALLQLLFFGNRRQSLTEFILSDLGISRYYAYRLDRDHRLFSDRAEVDDYLACAQLADHYAELRELDDREGIVALAQQLRETPVQHTASERRWWRLFNRVARQLERQGELPLALELYRRCAVHPAREREARVLEALGDWQGVIERCEQMLASPWGEEEREAAARILPRAQRKLGLPPAPRRRDTFGRIDLTVPRSESRVEIATAEALLPQWQAVHYVENGLVNGLFGLAFWEEIFSPVRGAFHNPFQAVPADMYDGGFYRRRRAVLEARLAELESGDCAARLLAAWEQHRNLQCRWVNWRLLSRDLLQQALLCIPFNHLLAMWRRMLFDPAEYRRGFPDLLALGSGPGDYCMIEVKGPGDTLQESQKRWLRVFAAENIPATVAWVQWCDD